MDEVDRLVSSLVSNASMTCGHPEYVGKAAASKKRLEDYIRQEVEKLSRQAGRKTGKQ